MRALESLLGDLESSWRDAGASIAAELSPQATDAQIAQIGQIVHGWDRSRRPPEELISGYPSFW